MTVGGGSNTTIFPVTAEDSNTFHSYNIYKQLLNEHGHIDYLKHTFAWVSELLPPGSEEVPHSTPSIMG